MFTVLWHEFHHVGTDENISIAFWAERGWQIVWNIAERSDELCVDI
jgi:hypothetical protein